MLKRGKGQAAIEYLMMVGLISIVVVPSTFLFYNYSLETIEQIDRAQIDKFGRDIITTAETVYYLGTPTRIVIEGRLPNTVENIAIVQDPVTGTYLLLIDVRTRSGLLNLSYPTQVNILGLFGEEDISPGFKSIRIEAGPVIGGKAAVILNGGEDPSCGVNPHDACIDPGNDAKYCFNNLLIDKCEECGCSGGLTCKPDGSCLLPKITSITPSFGPVAGLTPVTIAGIDFVDGASFKVEIGGALATSIVVVNPETITADTPTGSLGPPVDVVVTNDDGGEGTLLGGFTYVPAPTIDPITNPSPAEGSRTGGTTVVITGTGFVATPTVTFGGVGASVSFNNPNQLTVVTNLRATPGLVDVIVTNADGQDATLSNGFKYISIPTIDSITPSFGPVGGLTTVTISGVSGDDYITGPSLGVKIGGDDATMVAVVSVDTLAQSSI